MVFGLPYDLFLHHQITVKEIEGVTGYLEKDLRAFFSKWGVRKNDRKPKNEARVSKEKLEFLIK